MRGWSSALAISLLVPLFGCSARRAPQDWPAAGTSWSGRGRIVLSRGSRGFTAPCAFALDPSSGARVEVRDPFGTTRLLLFLGPSQATVVDPVTGRYGFWRGSSDTLPWSPSDLWAAVTGRPPAGARLRRRDGRAEAAWSGRAGRVKAVLRDPVEGPGESVLRARGGAELTFRVEGLSAAPFDPAVLSPPGELLRVPSDPVELLWGLAP
ncbi:MAG: hypothetical protein AB1347_11920 [Acidobacteriota bacterium]